MAEDDVPEVPSRRAVTRGKPSGERGLDFEKIPPEYLATLRAIHAEQQRVEVAKEQERRDDVQDDRDKRLWKRNAALALFLAVAFNNPSVWIKDLWAWLLAHVISIR